MCWNFFHFLTLSFHKIFIESHSDTSLPSKNQCLILNRWLPIETLKQAALSLSDYMLHIIIEKRRRIVISFYQTGVLLCQLISYEWDSSQTETCCGIEIAVIMKRSYLWADGLVTHLFVKVPRPGDSEETFSVFQLRCHLLLPV